MKRRCSVKPPAKVGYDLEKPENVIRDVVKLTYARALLWERTTSKYAATRVQSHLPLVPSHRVAFS